MNPATSSASTATIAGPDRLTSVGQIAINVHDVPRAVAFYRDALGLTLLFEAPPTMAFFDCDGVRLMLSQPSEPQFDHPSSILYFRVADIDAAHTSLVARGVTFERAPALTARMPDHELWIGFFRDPDGNLLAIMSEKR
jgi:methylmalonyl-CoA/ethylmalonyl-CoA epimerase